MPQAKKPETPKKSKYSKSKSKYSKTAVEQYVKQKTGRRLAFGYEHAQRVYALAKKLGSKYDDELLHATAFLHDIELGEHHEERSAKHAGILLKHQMSATDVFRIQEAIRDHVVLGEPKGVEAILVHDAALLDCLGGVGLLQLAFSAQEKSSRSRSGGRGDVGTGGGANNGGGTSSGGSKGAQSLKEIVKHIKSYRKVIVNKLMLRQSRALAAERIEIMDLALDALDREL